MWKALNTTECFMCAMRDSFPRLCEDCCYIVGWPLDVVFTWEEVDA